jgi:hypothetical protein
VAVAAAHPRTYETSSSLAAPSKRASRRPDPRIDNLLETHDQGSKTLDNVTHQPMSQTQA